MSLSIKVWFSKVRALAGTSTFQEGGDSMFSPPFELFCSSVMPILLEYVVYMKKIE